MEMEMAAGIRRRRSRRISAAAAAASVPLASSSLIMNHSTAAIKRKQFPGDDHSTIRLPPISKLPKQVWKGRHSPKHPLDHCLDWRATGGNSLFQPVSEKHDGKASIMPSKQTLELVLDTLQRRDNYEIFGEPVDPDEVEDYYEIIKEPMDFGTMRAKLHEGMYHNLHQFQHDLFLIPENAMHFNSSTTIYFRQACALHELAKKVFYALKVDPENFASEFSGTRRRSIRKALMNQRGDHDKNTHPKTHPNVHSKCNKNSSIPYNTTTSSDDRRVDRLCGSSSEGAVARRRTHLHDWGSSSSSLYHLQDNTTSPLVMIRNEEKYKYKDSLIAYVKDLGPTAQMVAKRKLLGDDKDSNNNDGARVSTQDGCLTAGHRPVLLFKTFKDFAPVPPPSSSISFIKHKEPTNPVTDLTIDKSKSSGEKQRSASSNHIHRVAKKNVPTNNNVANCVRSSEDNVRPVILALQNYSHASNANAAATTTTSEFQSRKSLVTPTDGPSYFSQFTFDLPFLRARLHQMNAPPSLDRRLNFLYSHEQPTHSFNSHLPLHLP